MDHRQLLRDLEIHYPGLADEYGNDAAARLLEDTVEEVDHGHHEACLRLRSAETVPRLFKYQQELVTAIERVCSSAPGGNIGLVALPTGAGKTRTAAVALLRILSNRRASLVLWLAPTIELLEQASSTIRSMWLADRSAPDLDLVRTDLVGEFPTDVERGVFLSTPQMIAARLKRGRVPRTDIVVFDEAHHIEAPVFRGALERLRREQGTAVIGLSATPGRTSEAETERLVDFFDGRLLRSDQLGRDPIKVLQRRGVLARVGFKEVPPAGAQAARSAAVSKRDVAQFRAVVRLARTLAAKSRVLVFAASVDYAGVLAAALRCEGTRAAAVSSRDDGRVRRSRLRAFEHGELSVIANKQLLATGYDCPAVRHVILATRIGSAILFEQIVGRASRGPRVGGHARSTVWQFDDHLRLHGLPQSYYRYRDYDWESPA